MKAKITQLSIILCLFGNQLLGQNWLGNTFSNYAGANGVYLNPSSIAESKYAYHVNLWGHGVNMYNNYLRYNAPLGVRDWIQSDNDQYKDINGNIAFNQSWLSTIPGENTKQFSFTQDIRMPSFMFPVGPSANMSINLRQRQSAQAFGISSPFAKVLRYGIDTNSRAFAGSDGLQTNQLYDFGDFSSNIENYQELSFTYAGNWSKTEKHSFNVGTTVKFIRGLGGAYFNSNGGQFAINNSDSMTFTNGNFSYGNTPYTNIRQPIENDYQLFYPSAGAGLGFDFGLTYMFNPNKSKYLRPIGCNENDQRDNYLIKLAAAVNDIGFINYKDATSYKKTIGTSGLKISNNIVGSFGNSAVDGFDTLNAGTVEKLGFDQSSGYVSQLPTALNVSADFRATKRFFVGLNWNQDLKSNDATGMRSTSYLAVIPRFEFRGLELAAPMVIGENYKDFNVGLYTRLGPFFLGSENVNGFLNKVSKGSYNSADIYGGMAFGIGHCPLWVEEDYDENIVEKRDTVRYRDTIYKEREINNSDTIIRSKTDTIIQKERTTDTITIEKVLNDERIERDLRRRESNVAARERNVAERERLVTIRENGDNCTRCNREKAQLETTVRNQQREIDLLKNRIVELERQTISLKRDIPTTDTVRISDCGPKIYKDEMGNKYDKCEFLELNNKNLIRKINLLELEKVRLENELIKCQREKEACEKSKTEVKIIEKDNSDERVRIEAERIRQEAARKAAEEARKAKEEATRKANEERREADEERIKREEEQAKQEAARRAAEEQAARNRAAEERARKAQEDARQAEARKAEEQRRAEESKRIAEEARKRAEAEQARKAAEAQRQEAARKAAEAARRAQEEAAKRANEEAAKRAAEERARKAAEAARQAELRKAEEAKRAEQARQAAEAAKRAAEEAAKKAQEKAAKKAAEEAARKAAEEARRKAEEEQKKKDDLK